MHSEIRYKYIPEVGRLMSYPSYPGTQFRNDGYSRDGTDPSIMWMLSDWNTGFSNLIPSYHEHYKRPMHVAVQAGGNVGLYPILLSKYFNIVYTFEPDPLNFSCLNMNCGSIHNIVKFQAGLHSENGVFGFSRADYHGQGSLNMHLDEDNDYGIDVIDTEFVQTLTIDSLNLDACDLIFLDIERNEIEAIKGAQNTINRYSPVIIVEHDHGRDPALDSLLGSLGYSIVTDLGQDAMYDKI